MSDRLPPHNLEIEEALIYCAVTYPETLPEMADLIDANDFFRSAHGVVFDAAVGLWNEGKAIDPASVFESLVKGGHLSRIGGQASFFDLIDPDRKWGNPANVRYHAQIVREKSLKRKLIEVGSEAVAIAYRSDTTFEDCINVVEPAIHSLTERDSAGSLILLPTAIGQAYDRYHRRQSGQTGGLPSGFPDLDNLTDGLHETNLIVLAGRPSMGKSMLAFNIADYVATDLGKPALFVSLEMSGVELGERSLIARSGVSAHAFRFGKRMGRQDQESMDRVIVEVAGRTSLVIDDTPSRTMVQIGAAARQVKSKVGLSLLVVDYIQLIEPDSGRDGRQEQVARISRRLKTLARELKVPVVALSQLNREVEKREDKRPRMSDLRESGAIEQDADMIWFVHRPEYYDANDEPGIAELIVAKNRNGRTGKVKLAFLGDQMRFASLAARQEPDFGYAPAADDF